MSAGVSNGVVGGEIGGHPTPVVPGAPRRFKFQIQSDFAQSRQVQDEIMKAVEAVGFSMDEVFAIKLALEEAMINAIKHGNKLDPQKSVQIEATVSGDGLEVVVHDQGCGFDRSSVPDPLAEENLEKNSGRGILLIEAYMNAAEWTDGGRRLRMYKKRTPTDAELAPH